MNYLDTLNGKNLFSTYGLIIVRGLEELLEFPERKPMQKTEFGDENGTEYDLTLVKFKDREVVLGMGLLAADNAVFWAGYNAFFAEVTKTGWQALYVADHGKTYQVFYKKTGNFKKVSKRLKGVLKVYVKFDLTLQLQQL